MNKGKILLVDDDRFIVDMYTMRFAASGFDVFPFFSANEVLTTLNQEELSPDVFLVDIMMPQMDGFELISKLKNEEKYSDSLFVVLSNLGQKDDIEHGKKIGLDGYIVKASATPSEVVQMISDLLNKSQVNYLNKK